MFVCVYGLDVLYSEQEFKFVRIYKNRKYFNIGCGLMYGMKLSHRMKVKIPFLYKT